MYQHLSRNEVIQQGYIYNRELAIRVSPAADKDFPEKFKELMKEQLTLGNLYVTEIVPLEILKKRYYATTGDEDKFYQNLFVLGFFIVNIFLGVIATFWLRTESRKAEMGLRMALGSTKSALKGSMLTEGLLLLSIVWLPAVLVCINLGYTGVIGSLLDLQFTVFDTFVSLLNTTGMMILMIVTGISYPA
ncbi:MAG: ABC transporter permease, partial [Tannerellaceae bacterium]|nr:ABC transporter permease [Tannerellaceae bacterium]